MDSNFEITYALEPHMSTAEFIDVLRRSTLAERRPVDDPDRIARMLAATDLLVAARQDGLLVGVARSITDWNYTCYLSDLAVDQAYQAHGIGRALIARTHLEAGPQTMLLLIAAPGAQTYYPHIGMQRHEHAYVLPRQASR
jgi:GNAT superfamily N-acetyltransferase